MSICLRLFSGERRKALTFKIQVKPRTITVPWLSFYLRPPLPLFLLFVLVLVYLGLFFLCVFSHMT